MKYEITFTAAIYDKDGYSRVQWMATHAVEIEHLSALIPMLNSVEKVIEDWREGQP